MLSSDQLPVLAYSAVYSLCQTILIYSVLSAALVLGEKLTIISVCGVIITFAGLLISENKINFKKIRSFGKAEE